MMEGPRHQHLHQEWQEPLEEQGLPALAYRDRRPVGRRAYWQPALADHTRDFS